MRYLLLAICATMAASANAAPLQKYRFSEGAAVEFTADVNHAAFQGRFRIVHGEVAFSPDRLEASSAKADIDLSSLETPDPDSEKDLKEKQWFDVATYATATFEGQHFIRKADGHFALEGMLSLHGVTKPVTIDFTLMQHAGVVTEAMGIAEIDRHAFNVGSGEWASDDPVAGKVKIALTLPVIPVP